jgi:hypothetical protein
MRNCASAKDESGWRCLSGKSAKTCQYPYMKIFRFCCRANQWLNSARLTRQEGRLAIVTNVRWDAVDAEVTTDERG